MLLSCGYIRTVVCILQKAVRKRREVKAFQKIMSDKGVSKIGRALAASPANKNIKNNINNIETEPRTKMHSQIESELDQSLPLKPPSLYLSLPFPLSEISFVCIIILFVAFFRF